MSDRLKEAIVAGMAPIISGAASLNGNEESNESMKKEKSKSSDSLLSETFFYAGNGNFDR